MRVFFIVSLIKLVYPVLIVFLFACRKESEIQALICREQKYCLDEMDLRNTLQCLQSEIESYLPNKMKTFFHKIVIPNGKITLEVLHYLTFLLLPAFPPPMNRKLQMKHNLQKGIYFFRS